MHRINFIIFLFLAGCAAEVTKSPTTLLPDLSDQPHTIQIIGDTKISFSSGYHQTIKDGSIWEGVGKIQQGNVYKILNDVFIIEGAHIHEANIVIDNNNLVGYYLTAIQSYSMAPEPTKLKIKYSKGNHEN